jgi:hypothetical protein
MISIRGVFDLKGWNIHFKEILPSLPFVGTENSFISIQAVFKVVQLVTLAALAFYSYTATSCEEVEELSQ